MLLLKICKWIIKEMCVLIDKNYCMSSYLAFRYIYEAEKDFSEKTGHEHYIPLSESKKKLVETSDDIDAAIQIQFDKLKGLKLGIFLSGGMDSAILASYMSGADAYTFRFMNGEYQKEELQRAEYYADYYKLNLHYVDINWEVVLNNVDKCMLHKSAPVHSIEPQLFEGAKQAKTDGIDLMVIGNGSDYVFGGMDKLLSKDWTFDEFYKRFIYIEPSEVLKNPVDMKYIFEKYREGKGIDYIAMLNDVSIAESYSSYKNAFESAEMPYLDPYEGLKMKKPLDLCRIRGGESKYLIRDLFKKYIRMLKFPKNYLCQDR